MIKRLLLGLLITIATGASAVQAQSGGSDNSGADSRPGAKGLLNERNLTSTGETVPHPGASQGAPTSDLDRRIEQENDKLDQSICSNCN